MASGEYRLDRPIALVGLMGAGKSTVGRALARQLELAFVDADEAIERAAGIGIGDYFRLFGESRFREAECQVLAQLAQGPPKVIATGGGAFVDPEIRALLLDRSLTIWLDVPVEILTQRVRGGDRPLLLGVDHGSKLAGLLAERAPFYAQAHAHLRCGTLEAEQVVEKIIRILPELGQ